MQNNMECVVKYIPFTQNTSAASCSSPLYCTVLHRAGHNEEPQK